MENLQGGFPICPRPFASVAKALGQQEQELIDRIEALIAEGVLSRFGPMINAERLGGAVTLALSTGAPILPTGGYFTNKVEGHFTCVRPPIPLERTGKRLRDDVQRITQLVAAELEVLIRRAPQQWHMFQPNWPSDPGYGVGTASRAEAQLDDR